MSIEQMRDAVMKLYSGIAWKERVKKMTDGQIIAIYNKSVRR